MKEHGLKDEEELQSWFIRRIDAWLAARGRRLIGWDEILEGGLAPGAAVMSWRGEKGGIAAAKAGHDVVMAPEKPTYFDHDQSADQQQPIRGLNTLADVYAYEPIPRELDADGAKHVLGAQGQLWTEYMPDSRRVEYMAWPRLCALAEVLWSPKATRDPASFARRMDTHLERLRILDVNFGPVRSAS
jgi:hexosaminidase